jgi:plasmid stabilization system protein ParE
MESKEDEYLIVWAPRAYNQFISFIRFIKNDSPQTAIKVQISILNIIYSLKSNPERFSIDYYRKNNKGSFRYFEKYKMRVSFLINKNEVTIVRCRHAKMKPKMY